MVWHAYQLNPRNFLEDCIRYGKLDFWRAGFPWAPVNTCIANDAFDFNPTEQAVATWKSLTGYDWDSLNDANYAILSCPMCKKSVKAPWTGFSQSRMWESNGKHMIGETDAQGFADKNMQVECQRCRILIRHDDLKLMKFRNDVEALRSSDNPMPGTILDSEGQ